MLRDLVDWGWSFGFMRAHTSVVSKSQPRMAQQNLETNRKESLLDLEWTWDNEGRMEHS